MNSTKNWIAVATLALITSCAEQGGDPGNTSMPDAGMMGIGGGMGGGAGGGIGGGAAGAGGGGAAACPDLDRDGFQDRICNPNRATGGDCDETNELRHPGRMENCGNMIDDDCDGVVNNGCGSTCADLDGDGFEDARCNVSRQSGADCDDRDINVNPGQMERCGNFKDDDCQGGDVRCLQNCTDNDLDGFGAGSGCLGPDCNDTNPTINPWTATDSASAPIASETTATTAIRPSTPARETSPPMTSTKIATAASSSRPVPIESQHAARCTTLSARLVSIAIKTATARAPAASAPIATTQIPASTAVGPKSAAMARMMIALTTVTAPVSAWAAVASASTTTATASASEGVPAAT